jgi:hypothetical protein
VGIASRTAIGAVLICACASSAPAQPAPAPEPPTAGDPNVDRFEYVAGEDEVDDEPHANVVDEERPRIEGDFALTTAEAAHAAAEEAVAGQLNPQQQWDASPVVPAQWPSKSARVSVYFYPMATHPDDTSRYELFSAAWVVQVSLVDGTTKVSPISGRRRLGTLEEARPSMLERRELEIAEQALVESLLGADAAVGENNYWGYLKFFREHPQIARDMGKRSPAFVKWLYRKQKRADAGAPTNRRA